MNRSPLYIEFVTASHHKSISYNCTLSLTSFYITSVLSDDGTEALHVGLFVLCDNVLGRFISDMVLLQWWSMMKIMGGEVCFVVVHSHRSLFRRIFEESILLVPTLMFTNYFFNHSIWWKCSQAIKLTRIFGRSPILYSHAMAV